MNETPFRLPLKHDWTLMDAFCNETLEGIKSAKNEGELVKVLSYTINIIRIKKNSNNEFAHLTNIITSLRNADLTGLSLQSLDNIKLALNIFNEFLNDDSEGIF